MQLQYFLLFEEEIPQYMYVPESPPQDPNQQQQINDPNIQQQVDPNALAQQQQQLDPNLAQQQMDPNAVPQGPTEDEIVNKDMEPIKKLYLIQKLTRLNEVLKDSELFNQELALVLKFGANISYPTLLTMSDKLITVIDQQLKEKNQLIAQRYKEQKKILNNKNKEQNVQD